MANTAYRNAEAPEDGKRDRLDSWKEIASYLGRQVRTVNLWEKAEKLPVHRHHHAKRGTVYAFRSELEAWKQRRSLLRTPKDKPAMVPQVGFRKTMIAVLPFANLSGDPSQEYFSDGLTEEVISQLGRIRPEQLGVVARTSTMHYKGVDKPIAEIGNELGVKYLLEGGVRRCNDRVRVTVGLIQATDQVNLWSHSYDCDLADIIVLQADVAVRIASSVLLELTSEAPDTRSISAPRTGTEAYEAYLSGRNYFSQRTEESLLKAVHYFSRAVQRDPGLSVAYAGLADAYVLLGIYGALPPHDVMPMARTAATKAVEISAGLGEAHAILAEIAAVYEWDWETAEKEYRRAIELNPSYPAGHQKYAEYLTAMRRHEEARAEIELARSFDPRSPAISAWEGTLLRLSGHCTEAISACIETLKMDPSYVLAHWALGLAYEQAGKVQEALSQLEEAARLSGGGPRILSALGHAQAAAGQRDRARTTLRQLQSLSSKRYVPAYDIALVYLGLKDEDQTIEFLKKALQERSCWLMMLSVEPRMVQLKSGSRFKSLLNNLGLFSTALL